MISILKSFFIEYNKFKKRGWKITTDFKKIETEIMYDSVVTNKDIISEDEVWKIIKSTTDPTH